MKLERIEPPAEPTFSLTGLTTKDIGLIRKGLAALRADSNTGDYAHMLHDELDAQLFEAGYT